MGTSRPNYAWSILTMKCPRCRRGKMFANNNPWNLRKVLAMPQNCPVCGQHYELEIGFWYGTGYVSYALSILISIFSFLAWLIIIGMSTSDDRFFWWMGINIVMLILLQPWIMRISRVIWLNFFVRYDPDFTKNPVKKFDYESESFIEGRK